MDATARAGIARSFSGGINVAFISVRSFFFFQELCSPPASLLSILAFLVPVLVNFIELQYQGQFVSPFETHRKTMWAAIAGLLLYCLAYDVELRYSSTRPTLAYALVISHVKVLSGSVSLVSLASILFPNSVRMVLYLLFTLLLASQVELLQCQLQKLWDWLHQRMISNLPRAMPVPERRTRRALINWRWFITPASVWNWLHQRMINNLPQAMPVQERRMRLALINRLWFITPASVDRGALLPL